MAKLVGVELQYQSKAMNRIHDSMAVNDRDQEAPGANMH